MTSDRKKPGMAFWVTVVVVVGLVGYRLSYGPFCWLYHATTMPAAMKAAGHELFAPCRYFYLNGAPEPIWVWYVRYVRWCADNGDRHSRQ